MRLKCIGCEVLARAIYLCAAGSPHIVDVALLERGLHNTPAVLRQQLQAQIDATSGQGYAAVTLAYGLCGNATAGLVAREIPLVVPRAHDCITLFLGSRQRYDEEFQRIPGTFWYTQDYFERRPDSGTDSNSTLALGSGSEADLQAVYAEYVAKYGKNNADYLMEMMGAWQQHYQRAAYIDLGVGDGRAVEAQAQAEAARRGWTFERLTGDLVLIRRLIQAEWIDDPDGDFVVVQPGQQIVMAYDDRIIDCGLDHVT